MNKTWIVGGLTSVLSLAACSNKVLITAETTGSAADSGGSVATSTTGSSIGGTGGSTGAGAPSRVITADTDIGQYQSISVDLPTMQPLVQGPFFVTDVVQATRRPSSPWRALIVRRLSRR